ncbi:MAG TPA: threonine/serine dehydratase, partial [bacterium]|nr:threonine/serine dehydratase [bacterium]
MTLAEIQAARARIAPYVRRTPLHPLPEGPLLKLESLQVTGSFKPRGAFNYVLANSDACAGGVITASSGNHGQAVAYVAQTLGLRAVVVVPETVAETKAAAITRYGAELIRHGRYSDERIALARELAERRRLHYIPPYDDPFIIAGQGTAGLEIVEQAPDLEVVLAPASGGGLLSGVAAAVKQLRPEVRVVGVEPEGAARFAASRRAGRPVTLERAETIADGLRVLAPGRLPWELTARYVDEFKAVSDQAILAAVRRILFDGRVLAEPSGAASVACALLEGLTSPRVVA